MNQATIQRLAAIPDEQLSFIVFRLRHKVYAICHPNEPSLLIGTPSPSQLQSIYPGIQGELSTFFEHDLNVLAEFFIQHYGCDQVLNENILREMINAIQMMEEIEDNMDISSQGSNGGGKYKYKGRSYVIRRGARCGKYILVKGKKVYLSQI